MGTYQIDWKPSALHELKRIDRQAIPRIVSAVEALTSTPFPSGVKKLMVANQHIEFVSVIIA